VAGYVLTLSCQDRPGIVHAVTTALLSVDGNITESAQFNDEGTGLFVMRTAFDSPVADVEGVEAAVRSQAALAEADVAVRVEGDRCRVLILVSKFDHCLVDLLYRWNAGDLPIDVVGIVSNHDTCRPVAEQYGIDYHLIPVTPDTKAEAEAALLDLVKSSRTDLVVLARYMQVLSDNVCTSLRGMAINIHHSFLPGFKGARPYHQAHARGVKLIGATAHYVTADLDEGPIIGQDVVRVGHVESADRLAAVGRDVERRVLSHAVRVHAERRVFVSGSRTVVF
jgi:formyltetrahydrofolate deformylase